MPTFDATDLDGAVSESGVVHENTANTDHNDASELKQGYSAANPYLSADLLGYWPLQEDSGGTAYDFSGGNNDGTVSGATQGSTGLLGTSSYSFDGTDDYVSLPDQTTPASITISAWIKWDGSTDTLQHIFSGGFDGGTTEFELFIDTSGNYQWRSYDGSSLHGITAGTAATSGAWENVVAMYDDSASEYLLYVNATNTNSNSDNSGPSTYDNAENWAIGASSQSGNFQKNFSGNIANVPVYNRALTSSEIQDHYNVVATAGTIQTQFKPV